ncbi:unnamed protein product [Spirodela intermedia]|uniref:Uncharacterized protein n=1 Tax=Spirodela intermedia TaxID=51605 RepID=A0A7I8L233_SPIIN|nr:unnamed protein product [Spirodela intermedia]
MISPWFMGGIVKFPFFLFHLPLVVHIETSCGHCSSML